MQGLVSVIVPTYNVEKYVQQAICSVLEQSYPHLEIIAVDDGSEDGTVGVLESIRDPRLRVYKNGRNRGVSYTRNRAIELSSGEWIALLDPDDWWSGSRLERLLAMAARHGADMVSDDLYLIRDGEASPYAEYLKSRRRVIGKIQGPTHVDAVRMIRHDFGLLQPLIRSRLIKQWNLKYEETVHCAEDFLFMIACLRKTPSLLLIPEPMYYYRLRANSLSSSETLAKSIRQLEIQQQAVQGAIPLYRREDEIAQALAFHLRRIANHLAELKVRELLSASRYGKAAINAMARPAVLKPLLKRLLNTIKSKELPNS